MGLREILVNYSTPKNTFRKSTLFNKNLLSNSPKTTHLFNRCENSENNDPTESPSAKQILIRQSLEPAKVLNINDVSYNDIILNGMLINLK